jgi:tRNA pseudouridine38-40 synthase
MHIKLIIEYDGTNFHGWQLQPDEPTIQGALEQALATILREPVRLRAAGRTDAGVHARGQVVAFRTAHAPELHLLCRSINALAGPDIAVLSAEAVPDDFDPRRDARARRYGYYIVNRPAPSPLWRYRAWHITFPLDVAAMDEAAQILVGEHDFSSFQDSDCDAKSPIRRMLESRVRQDGDLVVYGVETTAFLRHMVRAIVGTLAAVGRGELSVAAFREIFAARDRRRAGKTAPAHGLYLEAVRY